MAEITAAAVRSLRDRTDLPMMRCKQALVEAGGDEDKAIEILASQIENIKAKRADNDTSEGRIFIAAKEDGSEAALVDFQCETAPVAANDGFIALGNLMAQQLLEGPGASTPEELLAQPAPGKDGRTLQQEFDDLVNKIAEKFTVTHVERVSGPVGLYVHHDGKTGVLFQAEGDASTDPILRDVAMHIAALNPSYAKIDDLDPAAVQAERDRLTEEAKASGKPENIVEKIVEGRMKNFYSDQGVLEAQAFAKDEAKTVAQVLADAKLKAKAFVVRRIG
ncbi:MAG: translation elongation factor Ts [Rubinisphaera brasiliensis]|uniref:Elongation factor Ts n=1 Tax=Rubinisphaera brasiliensis (strain ATCC 49424 / DSM 5305 / JCM 21570 / IAM 15109 / NBRC 103401 / IFAM 1448) TaxID=756272 RepID=F0SJS8_RUBBR|nr:translation elongation factor Ts [Rubinisphaera brasiliensis]ADY61916.1 translation elongation factor Ts (EF-Ts) [Rubinisphaera brasiliensis DSM 5305]MBR9804642.1 translation elongation factor Ts [bacterium]